MGDARPAGPLLATVYVREDATVLVESPDGHRWETTGHLIVLRTPQGGQLSVTWPEDFQPAEDDE